MSTTIYSADARLWEEVVSLTSMENILWVLENFLELLRVSKRHEWLCGCVTLPFHDARGCDHVMCQKIWKKSIIRIISAVIILVAMAMLSHNKVPGNLLPRRWLAQRPEVDHHDHHGRKGSMHQILILSWTKFRLLMVTVPFACTCTISKGPDVCEPNVVGFVCLIKICCPTA